jgi:hypothetical protein
MRFCQRRYLNWLPEALRVAHYLGLAVQRFGQFAGLISIPNIGPQGMPQLISPLAKMHLQYSRLKIHSSLWLAIMFDQDLAGF